MLRRCMARDLLDLLYDIGVWSSKKRTGRQVLSQTLGYPPILGPERPDRTRRYGGKSPPPSHTSNIVLLKAADRYVRQPEPDTIWTEA